MSAKLRKDGWVGALSGFGTNRDKTTYFSFDFEPLSYSECADLYRGDALAARIVELPAQEMLREGFIVNTKDQKDAAENIQSHLKKIKFHSALLRALKLRRAFGGSAILLGANDKSTDFSKPLNLNSVISLDWLTVLESRELIPAYYYNDPTQQKYGQVSHYRLQPISVGTDITNTKNTNKNVSQVLIHETRLLIFQGTTIGTNVGVGTAGTRGWGDSVLIRVHKFLKNANIGWTSAAILLTDFSQAVFKIKGLAELVAKDNGTGLAARLAAVDLGRSVTRATLLDADLESFERTATPMSGLPEMLDKFAILLAASAGIPATRLFGQSPAGLNATGDADTRHFYDDICAERNEIVTPAIEKVVEILGRLYGLQVGWCIEYPPLWQPTDTEKAQARSLQAQSDVAYISAGVLTAREVAHSRFGGGKYNLETTLLDTEELTTINNSDES